MAFLTGEKKWNRGTCGKCGGSGILPRFMHYANGLCFDCNGKGEVDSAYWTGPAIDWKHRVLVLDASGGQFRIGECFYKVAHDTVEDWVDQQGGFVRKRYRQTILANAHAAMDAAREGSPSECLYAAAIVAAFKGIMPTVKKRALAYMKGSDLADYFRDAVKYFEGVRDKMLASEENHQAEVEEYFAFSEEQMRANYGD